MRWILLIALLAMGGFVGCGDAKPAASNGGGSGGGDEAAPASNSDGMKSYALSDLPEMDDRPMPVKDEGRVQFSLPAGWKPLAPKKEFLVACIPEENSAASLPRITISVADPPGDDKSSTTAENAGALASKLQSQLESDPSKKPIESCTPIQLGDSVWIRHVRKVSAKSGPAAAQALQTVRSGRLVTVELIVNARDNPKSSRPPILYDKELKKHRDYGYAVAANMKFPKDGSSAPASEEKPAEDKPAEENPAEAPAEK